jgi:glycosyltransferase involved in cell wall biosynthesis
MKTIFYAPIIRPGGGPGGYLYNLYASSHREATKNSFIFHGKIYDDRKYNDYRFWPLSLKAQIYLSARMIYFPFFFDYRRLLEYATEADAIVLHGPIHPTLLSNIRKRYEIVVFMPHSPSTWADEFIMDYAEKRRKISKKRYEMYRWTELINIAYADYIVFPSINAAESYRIAYPDQLKLGKTQYIESGITLSQKLPENISRKPAKRLKVAFVGRYNRHKGFDLFQEATKNLQDRADVEVVCAGGGPLRVFPHVKNLGWVNDINALLYDVDIVVVPNRVAYFDLWPLEAASAGKPIVFTPAGGNIDQQAALPDSILAADITTEALEVAILEAIEKAKRDLNWGVNNRLVYLTRFTAEAMLKRWDNFIAKLDDTN